MKMILNSLKFFVVMTVLTGFIYPAVVTGLAQAFFREQAMGSLIVKNGQVVGSELIGQNFTDAKYFWSRPSTIDYHPLPSSGTNLGLTSQGLQSKVQERLAHYQETTSSTAPPADLLLASGSGLDPHISPAAAQLQITRVAKARNLSAQNVEDLQKLVHDFTQKPDYNLFGESRVNVLQLNLALDQAYAP